tara:strand:- start:8256 stop:8540 length:285 start_codon:yes stop_codon:yes gene_type:complete
MSTETDFIDFIDLINYTLHQDFVEKWKYKYSVKFIKHFQVKVVDSLSKQKPLKISSLSNYLTKKCRYSKDQVENFFNSIDIDLYYPVVMNDTKR